jgi:transposase
MNPDLDTLATRLYVTIDDLLIAHPQWAPERPVVGITPKLTDAELITLAVIQALLGFTSEARFWRHADIHLRGLFPYLPQRPAYNKRLRNAATTMQHIIAALARDCPSWHDDLWLVDSTPVECGRSRETVKRSDLAGYANYGYCASHSRFFWGLRLHLITTASGLPVAYALTSAKTDERDTALAMIQLDPALEDRDGQKLMADKGYRSASFEAELNDAGITLIRPTVRGEKTPRPLTKFLKPFRQIIESVNQTLKAQLDLERHGGRKPAGVCARILQRLLALTAAIWHNETSNQPGPARSLLAYDH